MRWFYFIISMAGHRLRLSWHFQLGRIEGQEFALQPAPDAVSGYIVISGWHDWFLPRYFCRHLLVVKNVSLAACYSRLVLRAAVTAAALLLASPVFAEEADVAFQSCLVTLGERALTEGVDRAVVASVMESTKRLERVIKLDRSQPEFTRTFGGYYVPRVTKQRVEQGRALYAKHRDLLNRLQREYGVPGHYLLSFWGLETNYGGYFGRISTTDALATLACDQRRSDFFSNEFLSALKIIAAGDIEQGQMRGSWAGAIGNMQFLPSVFLKYAVDGDGDGLRDLWGSLPDSLASAANFLRGIGWHRELRWGREVRLPDEFDFTLSGRDRGRTLEEWVHLGIIDIEGEALPHLDIEAAVLVPSGHLGPTFLIYENFEVIMRWNRSEYYAITVGRLADRIAGGGELTRKAIIDGESITTDTVRRLQQELALLGYYDAGEVDGIFGPATRRALSRFQNANDMIADGYPNTEALQAVRNTAATM
jgi:membrane-bound lytic murein transglycosylase B